MTHYFILVIIISSTSFIFYSQVFPFLSSSWCLSHVNIVEYDRSLNEHRVCQMGYTHNRSILHGLSSKLIAYAMIFFKYYLAHFIWCHMVTWLAYTIPLPISYLYLDLHKPNNVASFWQIFICPMSTRYNKQSFPMLHFEYSVYFDYQDKRPSSHYYFISSTSCGNYLINLKPFTIYYNIQ